MICNENDIPALSLCFAYFFFSYPTLHMNTAVRMTGENMNKIILIHLINTPTDFSSTVPRENDK